MIKNWKRALAAGVILLVGIAAALFLTEENNVTTKTVFAMDTYMELTAYGRNAEEAIAAAEEEIHRLDQLLSTGNTDSEVAIWNRDKTGVLTEDTEYLIERSIQLWEETAGAFDITIYPVMRAWGFVNKAYRVPTDGELAELAGLLHYDFYWLSKEIKKRTGKTYTELVQAKRLAQAAYLLNTTSKSVMEIALEVGYDNISYFHRIFQKKYGMTPRKYRVGTK